jgi:aminoglycoside N3'-acetyltransferase
MDFKVSPLDVCNILIECVGNKGNILMPCYTNNSYKFSYYDKSEAGILSETFRNIDSVFRSLNSQFSMACWGKDSEFFCSEHIKSLFPFDKFSPYYKAVYTRHAKILLIGDTIKTHKLSLLHLIAKDIDKNYERKYRLDKNELIDSKGCLHITETYHRVKKNNKKNFKKITIRCAKNASRTVCFEHLNLTLIN